MRPGALFIATLLGRVTALDNTTSRIVAKLASYGVDAYEYFNSSVLLDSSLSTRSLGFCSELVSYFPSSCVLKPDDGTRTLSSRRANA